MGRGPPGIWLQISRLGLYLSAPVVAIAFYNDPQCMHKIINFFNYVVYPAEGPRPPIGEEIQKFREKK